MHSWKLRATTLFGLIGQVDEAAAVPSTSTTSLLLQQNFATLTPRTAWQLSTLNKPTLSSE